MNIRIILTGLLMSWVTISVAQLEDTRDELHFGVKTGLTYANVYDSNGEEFDADGKLGFTAGALLSIPIGTFIGIQPEVLFSQKGFEARGRVIGGRYDFKRTTNYLDIPLYFALKPSTFITILAGPQYSYLLSKKDAFTTGTTTIEQEQEFENENFRENTLSASIGLDVNIDPLLVGVRANWDLQENNGDGSSTTPRYKNQWVSATVGYRF